MGYKRLSAVINDTNEIKAVGDEIIIDGLKHVIDEISTYHEQWDGVDVHRVDYTLKAVEVETEELRKIMKI